jgi:hypothetical protein
MTQAPTGLPETAAAGFTVSSSASATGDGTTARSRAARRWSRIRWTVLVAACLAVVVAALAVTRPASSGLPYAPDSVTADGAQALAQVLGRQGVHVHHVTDVDAAVQAVASPTTDEGTGAGVTLLVTPGSWGTWFDDEQVEALTGAGADHLVLVGQDDALLKAASAGAIVASTFVNTPTTLAPTCALTAAQAAAAVTFDRSTFTTGLMMFTLAGTVTDASTGLVTGDAVGAASAVTACYPATSDEDTTFYALVQTQAAPSAGDAARWGTRTVTAVSEGAFLTNAAITEEGNAALALWLLGGHNHLVWLTPDSQAIGTDAGTDDAGSVGLWATMPAWSGLVGWWALLCVAVAALWQGRRLGPLVAEPLPVVVPAAETVRGRGRLYRRARARGHAAAALRAASADRLAHRLGLPRTVEPAALVDAISQACGQEPLDVRWLLYGPPPTSDTALAVLARHLDSLENERT